MIHPLSIAPPAGGIDVLFLHGIPVLTKIRVRLRVQNPRGTGRSSMVPTMSSSSAATDRFLYLAPFAGRDPAAIAAHVTDDFVNEHVSALERVASVATSTSAGCRTS